MLGLKLPISMPVIIRLCHQSVWVGRVVKEIVSSLLLACTMKKKKKNKERKGKKEKAVFKTEALETT